MKNIKIQEIPIASIIYYERNSKIHPAAQIAALAKSIREFGFLVPCVVRPVEGGKYKLAAGHGRLPAAKRAGLKTVPCIVAEHLTEKQFKAYVIADNKLSEMATWDADLLRDELGELLEGGFELDVLGFDQAEADRLLGNVVKNGDSDASGDENEEEDGKPDSGAQKGDGAALRTNIAYNIIFDTDEQQQVWFGFLRWLKQNVDGESIGGRLRVFIDEGGYSED